jgi:hypothetical protein
MKTAAIIFGSGIFFFVPVGIIYGILTDFQEMVGFPGLLGLGLMSAMIGVYIWMQNRSTGRIPSDDLDGEISDEAYEYGFYSPWSWWPIFLAAGAGMVFAGVAIGWWITPFGGVLALIGLVGLVYEYDRGDHAH